MAYPQDVPSITEYTLNKYGDKGSVARLVNGELEEFIHPTLKVYWNSNPFKGLPSFEKLDIGNFSNDLYYNNPSYFSGMTMLKRVVLRDTVVVPTSSFASCSNLEQVYMPKTAYAGNKVFSTCAKLQDDWLNESFKSGTKMELGDRVFEKCSNLVNLTMPTWIPSVSSAAYFINCTRLRRICVTSSSTDTVKYGNANPGSVHQMLGGNTVIEIIRFPFYGWLSEHMFHSSYHKALKIYDVGQTHLYGEQMKYGIVYTKILILRQTGALVTLQNTSNFTATTTPKPIKVYVPSTMISEYEEATNWVSLLANNFIEFHALEGSRFEDPYYDDTDIYNADRDSLDELL